MKNYWLNFKKHAHVTVRPQQLDLDSALLIFRRFGFTVVDQMNTWENTDKVHCLVLSHPDFERADCVYNTPTGWPPIDIMLQFNDDKTVTVQSWRY